MSGTVVLVSADGLKLLRDGLRSRIAAAARTLADREGWPEAREPERAEQDRGDLDRIVALRALLEEIASAPESADVSESAQPEEPRAGLGLPIPARTHGWALSEAVRHQLESHADMLRDAEGDEPRSAALARNMSTLQALALDILLAQQTHALHP